MILIMCVVSILFGASCERRPLLDQMPDSIPVPVRIYWDLAGFEPQNVTALIYNSDGTLFSEQVFENRGASVTMNINLTEGDYTIVVFNEKRNQMDFVHIRGHEHLTTLEAYVTKANKIYESGIKSGKQTYVNEPGNFATASQSISISREMIEAYYNNKMMARALDEEYNSLADMHPLSKRVPMHVKLNVKGLHNARMPALVEVENMAGGYMFATDRNTMERVTTQFLINNRRYDDATQTYGAVSETVYTLGVMGNRLSVDDSKPEGILMHVSFQLVDKERTTINHTIDITDKLKFSGNGENMTLSLWLEMNIPKLPDVKPEGGNGSGMNSDVVDWEHIDVPIEI